MSFFCCLPKSPEEKVDAETDTKNANPTSSSQSPEVGCCCYRCLVASRLKRGHRRNGYLLRKAPQVCDAAVDTEIDFGIILHDMEKGDVENFEEKDMRDHKFVSLQFDSKPGKVKYTEGSQVFYVEVRDKKVSPYRRNSPSDKSVSDEDELHMESETSTDVHWDPKSETRRRCHESDTTPHRMNPWGKNSGGKSSGGKNSGGKNPGIIYACSKVSPTNSIDSLTDKKILGRPFLREIEEDQEHPGDYNFPHKAHLNSDSKDGYNIGGGQFHPRVTGPDDVDAKTLEADAREYSPSSSDSAQSGSHTNKDKPGSNCNTQDFEGSESADISSQSVDERSKTSDQDLDTSTITKSSVSIDQSTFPPTLCQESLFVIGCPTQKELALTEDPSGLLLVDRTSSMILMKSPKEETRESNSCPDMTLHKSHLLSTVTLSPDPSRNSLTTENVSRDSVDSENGVLSVETQTDISDGADIIDPKTGNARPSVISVHTETEGGSTDEETSRNYKEKVSTFMNTPEKDPSTSNTESSSSQGSDSESSSGESLSSSNSEGPLKKNRPSNSSDSSCSTCSSSHESVRKTDIIPYADKDTKRCDKCTSSSSISSEGSSSDLSTSCTLSSSSSICSSSSRSKQSESPKEDNSVDLQSGNG